MSTFQEFQDAFFNIFEQKNFYQNKTYLAYISEPQQNDEDNIVDSKIVLPLLLALGFEQGDIIKNLSGGTKDASRPDFQIKLADNNIPCFLVEDKHTAYNLNKPDPLQQLMGYAASRGYGLGFVCNGRLLMGWDLSNQGHPDPILRLDLEEIVATYAGQHLLAQGKCGFSALTDQHIQDLRSLYRRFGKSAFSDLENLIEAISQPEDLWEKSAISQASHDNFDELLINDLKFIIDLLEEDIFYQLNLLLEEYEQYAQSSYIPGHNDYELIAQEEESAPEILEKLKNRILNHLRVYGVLEVEDSFWANQQLSEFGASPRESIRFLNERFLDRLKQAETKKNRQQEESNQANKSETSEQLDLIPGLSIKKQKELGIQLPKDKKITDLSPELRRLLQAYERIAFDWKAWQAKQNMTHAHAIKTYEFFVAWRNLVIKTVLTGTNEMVLRREFARETAYVYVIRLLMVRICEDKKLLDRKFSNGGFKYWKEEVEPRYLDLARGMSMDYLLEMSYRSAQSIYAHFFDSADLFNWYRISGNMIVKVLHVLNRFNLAQIDSDIIGMVYGRYVETGKHEQGRYFTAKPVVEYMLDRLGYCANNPEIRDKTLLDLAGGSGSFLVHAARRLIESYRSPSTGKIPDDYIPSIIQQVKNNLFCLDINPFACYLAETNLLIQAIDLLKQAKDAGKLQNCRIDRFNVYNTDSLLLPKSQEIRTPLLNPVLDLELSTLSQIKTRTGHFAQGFDFVVGNPPYVRADEPGIQDYRREIEASGRFITLHEKWDLFVPFVELACQSTKDNGHIGLIVSRGIQTNNYAQKLRDYIAAELKITQIDFFNNVKLFSDAVVSNTILFFQNSPPRENHQVQRLLHSDAFNKTQELETLNQIQYQAETFRQFVRTENLEKTINLEDICYCTVGMVLNAKENKAKGLFKKEDLIVPSPDPVHSKKYIDGENLRREYAINQIRYLEWNTARVPGEIRRSTIPEIYEFTKILFGMTSFPTYDRGALAGDGFYVPDSIRICVRWDDVYSIKRLAEERRQMYEFSRQYQKRLGDQSGKKVKLFTRAKDCAALSKKFDLRYIAAILASSLGKRLLLLNNRDENIMSVDRTTGQAKSRIYPDDLKEFPIKAISLAKQQPFIDWVDTLVVGNWDLYDLTQSGHQIKFSYTDPKTTITLDFLAIFSQLDLGYWSFLNAELQCFEVIGDRHAPITKIKLRGEELLNGGSVLLRSPSPLVLQFLERYLQAYERRGRTWLSLVDEGKIPKTEGAIAEVFVACDRLRENIQAKIHHLRQTYADLDRAINKLYGQD